MFNHHRRTRHSSTNIWPGYVDALATLILLFVFMLSVFMIAQTVLTDALSGRDEALSRLERQLAEMGDWLAMERRSREELEAQLSITVFERDDLRRDLGKLELSLQEREQALQQARAELGQSHEHASDAQLRIERLLHDVNALREQLRRIAAALDLAQTELSERDVRIEELTSRLNVLLAERVQELSRYRSEFFGRLREVLGEREDIRIVGDRFLFQSELFFASGSAHLGAAGRAQLDQVAQTLLEITPHIPADLQWILQVEGHTDHRPINTPEFPSNWQLSTARAQSIVDHLILRGVPPQRLSAAGLAEYHPLDPGDNPEALRRNRRIELRLTQR